MVALKKVLVSIILLIVVNVSIFSQNSPLVFTNNAIRLLDSATTAIVNADWKSADSISTRALEYDPLIADFYYVKALCAINLDKKPNEIIPLLEKSLDSSVTWYKYNSDSARLFLAKQLSIVKQPQKALELLNDFPSLMIPDAQLERVRIFYAINDLEKARTTVLNAARQYPYDYRFDVFFYKGEILQNKSNFLDSTSEYIQFFNKRAFSFIEENPQLLLYASVFSNSIEDKQFFLKTYNALEIENPLYSIYAMNARLISEDKALEDIKPFFEEIRFDVLMFFVQSITDSEVKETLVNLFTEYNGTLLFDFNADFYNELKVDYKNGRPANIIYDENQDGLVNWELTTDFGEPTSLNFAESNTFIEYSTWPFINTITENFPNKKSCIYNLVDNTLSFSVVEFEKNSEFENLGLDFYIPVVIEEDILDFEDIFNASYTIDFETTSVENGRIRFTLLDGEVKNALYTQNSTPYAYAYFNNGKLVSRNVDRDNNGTFEIVEKYSYDKDANFSKQKLIDEVVGFEHLAQDLYLQSAFVDLDNNGVFEFSQEYFPDGSIVTTWDRDSDGLWSVKTIQKLQTKEIQYCNPFSGQVKSIVLENNVPVSFDSIEIIKDSENNFYWLGESFSTTITEKIIDDLQYGNTAVSLVVSDKLWNAEKQSFLRIVGVKNGDMYFGEAFYE